ncbi:hypothetical protein A2619_03120 [candidate division WWE3 bacterium RIFOXYD1_FULL_39_9]|uniref:GH18 domain-containing protein n=1 Tax=candidate division WWE3 bacterium RIFOXYD1_FULL_39_9 TaxID=1802649 RepID=A0A1F4X8L8_UNCKA|nr:MAG: hypothetical protein A2619_03120 [candidate division WWE3 bacterium RIFOXYD1_FULL_39_9]
MDSVKLARILIGLVLISASAFILYGTYLVKAGTFESYTVLSPISKSANIFSFFKKTTRPEKIVYGYLPYWALDDAEYIQMDKITDIAYFGVYLNEDGTFMTTLDDGTAEPGYNNWRNNEDLTALISTAQSSGVRVSLTVISHVDEKSDKFLDCKACWSTFAANLKSELNYHKIKDVNLNFEYVELTEDAKANQYTEFVKFLSEDLDRTYGNSFLVVSTFADSLVKPRVTKIADLGKVSDALFIMGYDFHRPSSDNAGPVAPIDGIDVHAEYDIRTMIKDYLANSPSNKLILGVPYYGYNWVVESSQEYAKRIEGNDNIGYSQSQTYAAIMDTILETGPEIKWDELGKTPYFVYQSPETGSTRQVYFENVDSLSEKYDLVLQNDLAGVGIWALGYDGGYQELWDLLQISFGLN